ncbi:hypothetical protein R1CP_07865 [Rhodococcus opacus]|uniref:DUF4190 domain-containing protein n=1 Tax=Rhodococcus opacus TaxID=37919 RepID=A0A1B1K0Z3_RHOOP|nr:hypothetical protein [Rhodococcus opacus]ANS26294.1 hypothetical protein R1CP_07865 [Rhodococcus opacus]
MRGAGHSRGTGDQAPWTRREYRYGQVSLLCGVLSVALFWAYGIGVIVGVGAVMAGITAYRTGRRTPHRMPVDVAAGITAGITGIVNGLLLFLAVVLTHT